MRWSGDKHGFGGDDSDDALAVLKDRAGENFQAGVKDLKDGRFRRAEASFAAADACFSRLPTHSQSAIVAKNRRAAALMGLQHWRRALAVCDDVLARGSNIPDFPDELPMAYWGRAVCLEGLGRLDDACAAVNDLIGLVGSGSTAKQRTWVVRGLMLQARAAQANGQLELALQAAEAAVANSSNPNDSFNEDLLPFAERLRVDLTEKLRQPDSRQPNSAGDA